MKPDIGSESRFLPTKSAFDAPVKGVPVEMLPWRLVRKKLEWRAYLMVKNLEDMLILFDRIHEHGGRTDARTDGHRMTAKAALA